MARMMTAKMNLMNVNMVSCADFQNHSPKQSALVTAVLFRALPAVEEMCRQKILDCSQQIVNSSGERIQYEEYIQYL